MATIALSKSTLRPFQITDATSIAHHANNVKIYNQVRDHFPHPYTLEDAKNWIGNVSQKDNENLQLAIEVNGQAVGGIGLLKKEANYRHSRELGYWVGEEYWGKGIITEAVNGIIKYGFSTLGLQRIFARCYEHNKASQHVLKKCGFQLEGILRKGVIKNEKIIDEYCFSLLAEEFLHQ